MSPADQSIRTEVQGRELTVSNLEKVFYPGTGFTKGQLLDYYARIGPVMLPHIAGRPLTMKRFPNGVDGSSFFEKHAPRHAPDWMKRVAVPSGSKGASVEYLVVDDLASLLWVANLGTIEFHVPLWHAGRGRALPRPPDHMIFDLDPGEGVGIVACCTVALAISDELRHRGLASWPKTSGSKGLQLYAPLQGHPTWDRTRQDAHDLARRLEQTLPELVVSNMKKELRRNKVLIDWSQNHQAKTTVAVYSLRARPEPAVSTPVTWDEVSECAEQGDADLLRFTTNGVIERVQSLGDLFAPV